MARSAASAAFTALVTALDVMVAAVIACTFSPSFEVLLTVSVPDLPTKRFLNAGFVELAPSPGVSLCERISMPVILPSASMPIMTLTVPP